MKVLVAGWFSFEGMGASVGDLVTRDLVCDWLAQAGCDYDVALAPPFPGGVDWRSVDPRGYDKVVFVCGPFGNGPPLTDFLPRFQQCDLVGVNLTMLEALEVWNPFALLLERDSSRAARPDLAFLAAERVVPVVGVVLIDAQPEYRERDLHEVANAAIWRLLGSRDVAAVRIDTRLDENSTGLRTEAQIESLIARMDVVLTTRLHGTVLALKNGIPALVIDPVAGGAKVRRQAESVGWPVVLAAEGLSDTALADSFAYCLTEAARTKAMECRHQAVATLRAVREEFVRFLSPPEGCLAAEACEG